MKLSDYSPDIRRIKRTDLPDAMRLKDQEGWNQTRKDWLFLMEEDHICLVADYRGMVVATTAAAVYVGETAWVGMVLVDPAYRGMGISKKLLNRLVNDLSEVKNIGLDATEAGKRVYEKLGFVEEYSILRMVCHTPVDGVFGKNEPRLVRLNTFRLERFFEEVKIYFNGMTNNYAVSYFLLNLSCNL
jgi:GNAT superfamily N-acetyltransferase